MHLCIVMLVCRIISRRSLCEQSFMNIIFNTPLLEILHPQERAGVIIYFFDQWRGPTARGRCATGGRKTGGIHRRPQSSPSSKPRLRKHHPPAFDTFGDYNHSSRPDIIIFMWSSVFILTRQSILDNLAVRWNQTQEATKPRSVQFSVSNPQNWYNKLKLMLSATICKQDKFL